MGSVDVIDVPLQEKLARMMPWEWLQQRVRYFPWWLRHPRQYQRSEKWRRAVNMIGNDMIEDAERGYTKCGMAFENDRWAMYVVMERIDPEDGMNDTVAYEKFYEALGQEVDPVPTRKPQFPSSPPSST